MGQRRGKGRGGHRRLAQRRRGPGSAGKGQGGVSKNSPGQRATSVKGEVGQRNPEKSWGAAQIRSEEGGSLAKGRREGEVVQPRPHAAEVVRRRRTAPPKGSVSSCPCLGNLPSTTLSYQTSWHCPLLTTGKWWSGPRAGSTKFTIW